jgi:hypothetical protein
MTIIITSELIYTLDKKYAVEGIPFHERPLQAAIDVFNSQSFIDAMKHPRFEGIKGIYENVIPEVKITWPGMGTGLVEPVHNSV